MRSARMVLAAATATAALAIAAPAAYADHGDDGGHDKSSYSKEHDEESKQDEESKHDEGGKYDEESKHDEGGKQDEESKHDEGGKYDEESKHDEGGKYDEESKHDEGGKYDKDGKHDKPRGGVHTGGGALSAVNEDDWGTAKDPKYDPETYKDKKEDSQSEDSWSGKQDKEGKHEKPRGGVHTGGGGLASEPGVTAGGLAALAVLGTGAYALRRKKVSGDMA